MCKDQKKVRRTINIFKIVAFLGFGVFGVTGAGFYLDFLATERNRCHDNNSEFN